MTNIASVATAGIAANTAQFEASAKRVAANPSADLPSELVTQKMAQIGFEANVSMLKRADEMTKSLLDILA